MNPIISYIYSLPYLFFLILLLLLFFKGNEYVNNNKQFLIIRVVTFLLFLLFIGFRGHIYSDWYAYYPKFESLPTIWTGGIIKALSVGDMEPGFILYTIFLKSFLPNYFIWILINTVIDLWILDKIFKKYTKYYVLAFIVFFAMNGLMIEFNLYRNAKAIMLFLLSLEYLKNRKIIPYLLINLLGVTFHYSALLFIPLYFILNREIPRIIVVVIFIVSNVIFLFHFKWIYLFLGDFINVLNIETVSDKALLHANSGNSVIFSVGYFERIISFVLFTAYYKSLVVKNSMNRIFYNSFLCFFVFILCFSEITVFSERFSVIFMFSYWILYPNIYSLISSKRNKYIFLGVFILFLFLRTMSANKDLLAKYDNLLWGIENYNDRAIEFERFNRSIN